MSESDSVDDSPLHNKLVTATPKTILRQISLADPVPFHLDQEYTSPQSSYSIDDEVPPQMIDSDSDGTIEDSFECPSSPDISVCDSLDYRKPIMKQVSTPQLLHSSLLQRRLQVSPISTPSKPSNLRIPITPGSPDSIDSDDYDHTSNSLDSKINEKLNGIPKELTKQERVYCALLELLDEQKKVKMNTISHKLEECELALNELEKAQTKYNEIEHMMEMRNKEYQEMRQKLWEAQAQINFAKQDVQSSILMNQQIFEECVFVSKQLEETKMEVNLKVCSTN
jgi:hypothetical protein